MRRSVLGGLVPGLAVAPWVVGPARVRVGPRRRRRVDQWLSGLTR